MSVARISSRSSALGFCCRRRSRTACGQCPPSTRTRHQGAHRRPCATSIGIGFLATCRPALSERERASCGACARAGLPRHACLRHVSASLSGLRATPPVPAAACVSWRDWHSPESNAPSPDLSHSNPNAATLAPTRLRQGSVGFVRCSCCHGMQEGCQCRAAMGTRSDGNARRVVETSHEVRSKRGACWCVFICPVLFLLICSRVVLHALEQA